MSQDQTNTVRYQVGMETIKRMAEEYLEFALKERNRGRNETIKRSYISGFLDARRNEIEHQDLAEQAVGQGKK